MARASLRATASEVLDYGSAAIRKDTDADISYSCRLLGLIQIKHTSADGIGFYIKRK